MFFALTWWIEVRLKYKSGIWIPWHLWREKACGTRTIKLSNFRQNISGLIDTRQKSKRQHYETREIAPVTSPVFVDRGTSWAIRHPYINFIVIISSIIYTDTHIRAHTNLDTLSCISSSQRVCMSIYLWKHLFGERIFRRSPFRFPICDRTSFSILHPVNRSSYSWEYRDFSEIPTEDTTTLSHYRDYAGLKFRFRSSETNCVNLRQYAIRSCLRFLANKFTSRKQRWSVRILVNRKQDYLIPSFILLQFSRHGFNSDRLALLKVIIVL